MAYLLPSPTDFSDTPNFISTYGSPGQVVGFEMEYVDATTFTVSPGWAHSKSGNGIILYPSVLQNAPSKITVDITQLASVGQSGAFPSLPSDLGATNATVYGVYALSDDSGKNETIVVVATGNNFIPDYPEYNSHRRIGSVYLNAAGDTILPFVQSGSFNSRHYLLQDAVSVLSGGASETLADIDLSSNDGPIVPGLTEKVFFGAAWVPVAAADTSSITATGLTPTSYPVIVKSTVAAEAAIVNFELIPGVDGSGNASISYINSAAGGSLTVAVAGWTENLCIC